MDYPAIPAKFEQYQDQKGFLWQANKEGSLTSGETQYLPSGLKIFVNGKPFAPASAKLVEEKATNALDLTISQKAASLTVQRQHWFDLERGGVRVLDTIKNTGKTAKVKVELKTAFQFPWQNLVDSSGRILAGTATVDVSNREVAVGAKFSAADGRQDTILLFGGVDATTPAVSASSNSRELVLTYDLTIPGGESRSLIHWILRRNLSKLDEISGQITPFYNRKQLSDPRVSASAAKLVANFSKTAFPGDSGPPAKLNQLVALNETLKRAELQRGAQDVLWLSPTNQLRGAVDTKATVKIGDTTIPISKVAAIEGGSGIGKTPRVFLRNGTVQAGAIELIDFALKVGDSWAVETWDPDKLRFLLMRYDKSDGAAPTKTTSFVELRTGEIIAINAIKPSLSLVSVWGRRNVTLDAIDELQYLSIPRPEYRLIHSDGSSLSVLPVKDPLEVVESTGATRNVDPRMIQRIWKSGLQPTPSQLFEPRWQEISNVPKGIMPEQGFLLQGNNLYAGAFADASSITMIDGNSSLDIAPSQISSMRKLDPSLRSSLPQFEIELVDGNLVKGGISQATLRIGFDEESWQVPVRHIIAYQTKGGDQ